MATAKATKPAVQFQEPADEPVTEPEALATEAAGEEPEAAELVDPRRCVVNDGRCVGRAVNGVVCSYHANAYHPDGRPR